MKVHEETNIMLSDLIYELISLAGDEERDYSITLSDNKNFKLEIDNATNTVNLVPNDN